MKKCFLLSLLLSCFIGFSQPIAVSTVQYTVPELVTEVLINTPCAEISNITWNTGTNHGSVNGIGYFSNLNPNFPMTNGIILSTSAVSDAPGPQGSATISGNWPGDPQLFNYMTGLGIDPFLTSYNDASVIEFDFLPFTDRMSFNFLFASREYGIYQCDFSDAFAFFLTNTVTGEVTNLALIPGTNLPISVITIRDEQYNGSCNSENVEYFGAYNVGNPAGAINYTGQTVKMVAASDVTPGVQYHIKLVIADRNDHIVDSAVFIEGGSFDIGQLNLGENRIIADGSALCVGEEYELTTGLDPASYNFQWTKDGVVIPGANGATYTVSESGLYGVLIDAVLGNCEQDPIPVLIEFFEPIAIDNPPKNLQLCPTAGDATIFDLTKSQEGVSTDPVLYSYFLTEQDALDNVNSIPSLYSLPNDTVGSVTIWVRIVGLTLPCSRVESFTISFKNCQIVLQDLPDMSICVGLQPNSFNILAYKDVVYYGTIGYTVTFYYTEAEALAKTGAIDEALLANYAGTDGETIWVRVQDDNNNEVYGIQSFKLHLNELPVVNTPPTLFSCEILASGLATFDLSLNQVAILGVQTNLSLEYYRTLAEAEIGNQANLLPLIYTGSQGSIFIRVLNESTGCYSIVEQPLVVVDAPGANTIDSLQICDVNNDGYGIFNLEPTKIQIAGNPVPNGVEVTYHETLADAQNNANAIDEITAYNNINPNSQTLYVRVGYINSKCAAIVPLDLVVNPIPNIIAPTPLSVCDTDNNSIAFFDLTTKIDETLNGLNPLEYNVTFHINENNAIYGTNPITNPTSFSNLTAQFVFIRVENISTGCYKVVRLILRAEPTPVVVNPLPVYEVCDTDYDGFYVFDLTSKVPSIIGTQVGVAVSFHYTQADANSGSNPLPGLYQNVVQNVQTIFVRLEKVGTGCYTVTQMDLRVNPIPVLTVPMTPFQVCNTSQTGYGTINLPSYNDQLLNGGPEYILTYFETQANAQNNVFPIANPALYNNINSSTPSVWVRAVNQETGCFSVSKVTFEIVIAPRMPLTLPELVTCDVLGNLYDAKTPFDLTVQTPLILAAQTVPGSYTVRYFTTEALANNGVNWIANPQEFINSTNPQTIWVRIQNDAHPTICYTIKSFTLKVNIPLQLGIATPLVVCDDALPNDEKATFDLTVRANQITQGEVYGTTLRYYVSEEEAKAGYNAIANPEAFVNQTNPQTIWVAVTNMYGCVSMTTLTVRVLPLPEPNLTPAPLEYCETELGGGMASVNLRLSEPDISNGDATGLSYTYFTDEADALANVNAIGTPEDFYTGTSVIYVRVTNKPGIPTEQCSVIVPLQVIVNSLPQIGPMTTLVGCEQNTDGFFTFNLHDKDQQALAGQTPSNYTVKYYFDEDAANAGLLPLAYTYTNVLEDNQTIFVRVENKATGCYSIQAFDLKVEEKVFAYPPSASLVFCDTDGVNDGFGPANLTTLNAGIISTQNLTGQLDVRYYTSWANYNAGNASPSTTFPITSAPQLVIAEVFNPEPGSLCTAVVQFYVTMVKAPSFDPIKDGYVCTDFRTGNVNGYLMDTELPSAGYSFTWTFNGTFLPTNEPSYVATQAGTYVVTVTAQGSGCSYSQTINVLAAPRVSIDQVNITDGFADTNGIEILAVATAGTELEYALDSGSYQSSNIFLDVTPGTHTVWVKVKGLDACPVSKVINVLNYPKFFTPNGDGYNDTWNIFALKDQPEAKIYIFDRQGKLLKQLSPASEGWDGTFNGKELPSTDYWFKAEFIEPNTGLQKEATGHFSLKR